MQTFQDCKYFCKVCFNVQNTQLQLVLLQSNSRLIVLILMVSCNMLHNLGPDMPPVGYKIPAEFKSRSAWSFNLKPKPHPWKWWFLKGIGFVHGHCLLMLMIVLFESWWKVSVLDEQMYTLLQANGCCSFLKKKI